ncbi:MAG: hypothetical protein KDD36_08755 [Flavobacteriales bacterium]|nr:hypothetical protein [Flavobacteriales bacterium]
MTYQSFREKVNLKIYHSRDSASKVLRLSGLAVALVGLGTLIYSYGFPQDQESKQQAFSLVRFSLAFFVIHYAFRIIYTFDVPDFLRKTWFEGLLMVLVLLDGISSFIFQVPLVHLIFFKMGFENITPVYLLFVQLYLLIIIGIELNHNTFQLFLADSGPVRLIMTGYLFWILLGACLLLLPECTTHSGGLSVMQSLFTSISAVTLCGLSVLDISTELTYKGHIVILFLMQVGGINILAFATYISTHYISGVKGNTISLLEDFQSLNRLFSKDGILRSLLTYCLVAEIGGAICLFFLWDKSIPFGSSGQKVFYSFFHAVSAFNNGGFTLFPGGFLHPYLKEAYIFQLVIIGLVFAGALGFLPAVDMFGIKNLRMRLKMPWMRLRIPTRIAMISALFLAMAGTVFIYFLEHRSSMEGQNISEGVITSLFMVVNRSGGFSTLDLGGVSHSLLMVMIILMFIGGASGSVAGGVKTSTFTTILVSGAATVRGRNEVNFERHTLPFEIFSRAFTIVIFFAAVIIIGSFALSVTEPEFPVMNLFFEQVSAVSLSGLTTGVTRQLSIHGQWVVMTTMLMGRVGVLVLLHTLGKKATGFHYHYPRARITVG